MEMSKLQADEDYERGYLNAPAWWCYTYRRPSVTATVVLFDPKGRILIGRRVNAPYAGEWCLPGGFLNATEETTQECARRELQEETGLLVDHLKLFHVSSNPMTDPRGHVVNVCYWGCVGWGAANEVSPWDDLDTVGFWPYDPTMKLAFDHHDIIERATDLWMKSRWWRFLWDKKR